MINIVTCESKSPQNKNKMLFYPSEKNVRVSFIRLQPPPSQEKN